MWWKKLTPFRVALVLYLGYYLVTSSDPASTGPSDGGGLVLIALFLGVVIMWLVDMLMVKLIKRFAVLVVVQIIVLLVLYFVLFHQP